MEIGREQAIRILDRATDRGGFDDWWADMMAEFGLYDEKNDSFPNIYDVFNAVGITKEECQRFLITNK